MKRKFYISGKITGLKEESWRSNFSLVSRIEKYKHPSDIIVNPVEIPPWHGNKTWSGYLRADIAELCDCTDIVLMKNWWSSKGALTELLVAKILGLKIHFSTVKIRRK